MTEDRLEHSSERLKRIEWGQQGVIEAVKAVKKDFGEFIEKEETFDELRKYFKVLPEYTFRKQAILELDENILGYRQYDGTFALNADRLCLPDHAFQIAYHECLEELGARFGQNLRSFYKFHDGIIQYFVKKAARSRKMRYFPTDYEPRVEVVKKLIKKGVPERLWKQALVDNDACRELMEAVDRVTEKQGFRKIDWALDEENYKKIERILA